PPRGRGQRTAGVPGANGASLPGRCGIGDHWARPERDRFVVFLPTRDCACLHEGAGPTTGPEPAVHTAPRTDRGGCCAALALACGGLGKIRAGVGQIRIGRTACRPRPCASRWRPSRVAYVKCWWNSLVFFWVI